MRRDVRSAGAGGSQPSTTTSQGADADESFEDALRQIGRQELVLTVLVALLVGGGLLSHGYLRLGLWIPGAALGAFIAWSLSLSLSLLALGGALRHINPKDRP
jgi:hypothetical protein